LLPTVSTPTDHVYFRPISVTAVLAKVTEKTVVRQFLQNSATHAHLHDHLTFNGATLIYILHAVT